MSNKVYNPKYFIVRSYVIIFRVNCCKAQNRDLLDALTLTRSVNTRRFYYFPELGFRISNFEFF